MKRRQLFILPMLLGLALPARAQITKGEALGMPWPMAHQNASRTKLSAWTGPSAGAVGWEIRLAALPSGIAVDDLGNALTGSSWCGDEWSWEYFSYKVSNRGAIRYKVETSLDDLNLTGANSTPAVSERNRVTWSNASQGRLIRMSEKGRIITTVQLNPGVSNDSNVAITPDGNVYHYQEYLRKFSPTGTLLWQTPASSRNSDVAVAPNGESALGGVRSTQPHGFPVLTYFNSNGTERWRKTSPNGAEGQPIFGSDGTLYYLNNAYNRDGVILFTFTPGGTSLGIDGSNRLIVVGSDFVRAINRFNGALIWHRPIPGVNNIQSRFCIDSANRVYFATTDGRVGRVNADGALAWITSPTVDTLTAGPALGADNSLYIAGERSTGVWIPFVNQYSYHLIKIH